MKRGGVHAGLLSALCPIELIYLAVVQLEPDQVIVNGLVGNAPTGPLTFLLILQAIILLDKQRNSEPFTDSVILCRSDLYWADELKLTGLALV